MLVAPVVNLQGSIGEAHSFNPAAERVGVVGAEIVEVLVVNPQRQDEVEELPFGDVPAHTLSHLKGFRDIRLPVLARMDKRVWKAH